MVVVHHGLDDGLENGLVGIISNTIAKRKINSVILSHTNSNVAQLASTGEILSVLMEGAGHNSVGSVKSLLNTITMMDINVDIKNALLVSQELENGEDDV